jgi:hypothetical protein
MIPNDYITYFDINKLLNYEQTRLTVHMNYVVLQTRTNDYV